jgi:hypothetical protein
MAAKNVENSSPSPLTAALIGLWAVVLLIAFFSYRGSDIGQIGRLFGNLGGSVFGTEGFRDSLVGGLFALLILISWFGVGSFLTLFIKRERPENHSHILEIVIDVAIGAAVWSLTWFFLGLLGLYNPTTALGATFVGVALASYGLRRIREIGDESRTPEKASGIDRLLLGLIAVPVVLALIASMAPPTAKDTLLYHFALPKAYIAQGNNAFVEGNMASYLALGGAMHNVWAMQLGGLVNERSAEAAAGAVNWLFFPLLLAAIFGWSRELNVNRRASLIAVLMVAAIPTAYHIASSSYIDLELAFYVTLAIYTLARWWNDEENGWLVLTAIFLGASFSMKLTSVFVFAAFALIVLLRARKAMNSSGDPARIVIVGFASLLAAFLIASPWYLRTWMATGSPVFPFYMSIWKGEAPNWDVERSNLFQGMNSQYGGENKTAVDILATPWTVSVRAQPESAEYFDGVLGAAFLIGVPLLVWALWKLDLPAEIKIGAAVAAIMYLFWLFSSQQLRYLLPIVPVVAIGIVASIEKLRERDGLARSVAEFSLAAAAVSAMLVTVAWFLQKAPVSVVLGGETRDAYLARNLDYYPYYQYLNTETPADARVWLIDMRRDTYDLERPAVSDYLFEDWTLRQLVWQSRSTPELKAKAAAMGVQYILTRHDFLFDYSRSTIVDDKKPRAENDAKLQMAKDLILDPARTVKSDDKFSLVKLY